MTMETRLNWFLILAGLGLLAAVPAFAGTYKTTLASQMLIFAILAMSIDLLAGFAGLTTLCHGAIFGVSTYVVLYYTSTSAGSPWVGAALGIAAATFVAVIFAILAIRTAGVYFLLLTLALGMIIWGICLRWTSVTGGENGIRSTIRPAWLLDSANFYYFTLAIFIVLSFAMWRFVKSPFGLSLQGIRESESRMRALGYNVSLHLFIGFTISGFFAGAAGALYAFFNGFVSPTTVGLSQSVAALLMAIVGGVGTLFGGLVGSIMVTAVQDIVSIYTDRWSMLLGLMFIGAMVFAPEGVLGKARAMLDRRTQLSSSTGTSQDQQRR
jgi:branched-chain amino acid transport system permease protein